MSTMALAETYYVPFRFVDTSETHTLAKGILSNKPHLLYTPQYHLMGSIAPGWEIIQPLLLTREVAEDGYCVFSDDLFMVYGDGPTPYEALHDYITSLLDYYHLVSSGAQENPFDLATLGRLQTYLRSE